MQVLKFGGSSVANAANMARVADIVTRAVDRDRTILVCSAISGFTDALIRAGSLAAARDEGYKAIIDEYQQKHHDIIRQLLPEQRQAQALELCDAVLDSLRGIAHGVYLLGELSEASLDAIQGTGELLSTRIMALLLASAGISVKWVDSREIIMTFKKDGTTVVDTAASYANMAAMLERNPVTSLFVLPGFIASDSQGRTTTLGRGGSDYSASLLAVGCGVRRLEIWTDVTGMMTANPRIVPSARTISNISYRAALELSHFGAKVIYPPTIQPVVSEGIPIYVKNTFCPDAPGTLIEKNPPRSKERLVGISNSDKIALISLEGSGMVGVPGFSARLFESLSRSGISIILITQASSVNTMCVAISEKDAAKAKEAADSCFAYEISLGKLNPLKVEKGFSIVCLVGDDIMSQCGTTGRMLAALGRHGISIRATAQGSSERNISVVVRSEEADRAIGMIRTRLSAMDRQVRVIPENNRPVVLFQVQALPPMFAGANTFCGELIRRAGGHNPLSSALPYPLLNVEDVLALRPDVILIPDMARVDEAQALWRRFPAIPAVQHGRIHVVSADLFNQPTLRSLDALETLHALLYPPANGTTQLAAPAPPCPPLLNLDARNN